MFYICKMTLWGYFIQERLFILEDDAYETKEPN